MNLEPDPILEEIHQTRREISDRFGGDFIAMLDDARRRQEASGRPIWKPTTANAGQPAVSLRSTSVEHS